jgi:hypothetical protein
MELIEKILKDKLFTSPSLDTSLYILFLSCIYGLKSQDCIIEFLNYLVFLEN